MSDRADQRAALIAGLEPVVRDMAPYLDDTPHQTDRLVAFSQAISLRRIADSVSGSSLDETLRDFVNNLGNTLTEHRMYSK